MTPSMERLFARFRPYEGPSTPGSTVFDFLGSTVRHEFVAQRFSTVDPPFVSTAYPALNEDIIAWVDILQAVTAATDSFTMVELGAGYGLWSIRAGKAFRQINSGKCTLIAIEAEPVHYQWLQTHFQDNGFDTAEHRLIHAAISSQPGTALFFIGSPEGDEFTPKNWYGQRIKREGEGTGRPTGQFYEGRPVLVLENGWRCIELPVVTLETVLQGAGSIDFVHVDLQGQELDVIGSGIDVLDRQVRHIHIGTHSAEIEEHLRTIFRSRGWHACFDYPGHGRRSTPYGEIEFEDGVQAWRNPRFS